MGSETVKTVAEIIEWLAPQAEAWGESELEFCQTSEGCGVQLFSLVSQAEVTPSG